MKPSQEKQILAFLKSGKRLTPLEALKMFGCFRLGARAYDRRKKGIDVKSKLVKIGDKHVSQYYI